MKLATLLSLLLGWVISCEEKKYPMGPPVMPDRVLQAAILVNAEANGVEVMTVAEILNQTRNQNQGIHTIIIAPTLEPIITTGGIKIIPDYALTTDSIPTIDLLIVPCSVHPLTADSIHSNLLEFVQITGRKASYIMGLGEGVRLLAQAGLLNTYYCTAPTREILIMKSETPQVHIKEDVNMVVHSRMITSVGGANSFEPALYLVTLLYGETVAKDIAQHEQLNWDLNTVSYILVQ